MWTLVERCKYLHLLKKTLLRYPLLPIEQWMAVALKGVDSELLGEITAWAGASSLGLAGATHVDPTMREWGLDWPEEGETMIGLRRLANIEYCINSILQCG